MTDRAQALDKPMVEARSREERIREAAYLRYLARRDRDGDARQDWLEAEAEIQAQDAIADEAPDDSEAPRSAQPGPASTGVKRARASRRTR